VTSTVVEELQRLLLIHEELNNREGAIVTWEDGLAAAQSALGKVCTEHDAAWAHTKVIC
jgi:hypothetical protein